MSKPQHLDGICSHCKSIFEFPVDYLGPSGKCGQCDAVVKWLPVFDLD